MRVGKLGAQGDGTGALVYRHVGELELAVQRVGAAVFQPQRDLGRAAAQRALRQRPLQRQQSAAGLGDVHIDGVELLHRGQRSGLVGGNQRAHRHRRLADAPADGRIDAGVVQVDLGSLQRGLGRGHIGLALQLGGGGVVGLLLAHGLDGHQLFVAAGLQLGGHQRGLGLGQRGLGAVDSGAVTGRVYLVEQLTCLDLAAFHKLARLHQAGDLGPHIGHFHRRGAPGKLAGQRHALGLHHDVADLGCRRGCGRGGRRSRLAAGRQRQHYGQCRHGHPGRRGPVRKVRDLHGKTPGWQSICQCLAVDQSLVYNCTVRFILGLTITACQAKMYR